MLLLLLSSRKEEKMRWSCRELFPSRRVPLGEEKRELRGERAVKDREIKA